MHSKFGRMLNNKTIQLSNSVSVATSTSGSKQLQFHWDYLTGLLQKSNSVNRLQTVQTQLPGFQLETGSHTGSQYAFVYILKFYTLHLKLFMPWSQGSIKQALMETLQPIIIEYSYRQMCKMYALWLI